LPSDADILIFSQNPALGFGRPESPDIHSYGNAGIAVGADVFVKMKAVPAKALADEGFIKSGNHLFNGKGISHVLAGCKIRTLPL